MTGRNGVPIEHVGVDCFRIPTDRPESDGTLEWSETTIVVVEVSAGGATGIGYTYADRATARIVLDRLRPIVCGMDALSTPRAWEAMVRSIRNVGVRGVSAMAVAGVDAALWDLKAKILGVALVDLLGAVRDGVAVYGSGGFTSYSIHELTEQLEGWARDGIRMVKMKIGRDPAADRRRVEAARRAIGDEVQLFVDANGAYDRKLALHQAEAFALQDVRWFEEPVSSDDRDGLRLLRDRMPAAMDVAAGEYGYAIDDFRLLLDVGAVDVLQADATRCMGVTGFARVAALCAAQHVPLSCHTAPSLHAHVACSLAPVRHVEYFHDHVRIEAMLFDGALRPTAGALYPDRSRPGLGIELKRADAARLSA